MACVRGNEGYKLEKQKCAPYMCDLEGIDGCKHCRATHVWMPRLWQTEYDGRYDENGFCFFVAKDIKRCKYEAEVCDQLRFQLVHCWLLALWWAMLFQWARLPNLYGWRLEHVSNVYVIYHQITLSIPFPHWYQLTHIYWHGLRRQSQQFAVLAGKNSR